MRSPQKAGALMAKGVATVILDFDDESTHRPALNGIDHLFLVTGYTVDMLRQSKALLDSGAAFRIATCALKPLCGTCLAMAAERRSTTE